ncbi:MAG: hypothetical protein BWY00_01094 [Firmicutes bacterium ADurb.Bin153]|nr:MAG: hypothetical protein BWY00_01094 [Firmicutes bacterium ADurb.Bin153]
MSTYRYLEGAVPVVLHVEAGKDIAEELGRFFTEGDYKEIIILGCAGSLERAVANYPKDMSLPPVVEHVVMEGAYEVCTINGNVTWEEGKPKVHIHGSFAEKGTKVYGGAIGKGTRTFKSADFFLLAYK